MTDPRRLATPSPDLIAKLTAIVGPANAVLAGDPAQHRYLREWRDRYIGASPLVLRPSTTAEVAAILTLCNDARVGIVPQSGNTGLVGGGIPHEAGTEIVVSLERMARLRDVDPDSQTLTAEAGVTLATVQSAARDAGLLFPLSMASEGSACIGGNLATNAGGIAVLAYGTARQQVLGLEVVLADGRIWNGLSRLKKDNTGYDLRDLFIGSEGTLGVITAATLKLVARPHDTATALVALPALAALVPLFRNASAAAGPALTAFEFMSARAMEFARTHGTGAASIVAPDVPCTALIEISAAGPDRAAPILEEILAAASAAGLITDARLAASQSQEAALWRLREQMSEVQKHEGGSIKHDISLPIGRIPEFLERAAVVVERICPGARPVPFGHLGDGNIHYNVSQPRGMERECYLALWDSMSEAIHDLVTAMHGSISAEHGIGRMKRAELQRLKDPVALDLMRAIKGAVDPHGILNPGKVL